MTHLNGESCRTEKFGKFLAICSIVSSIDFCKRIHGSKATVSYSVHGWTNTARRPLTYEDIVLPRDLIRFKAWQASRKVCPVYDHNIYQSQTSLTSGYFSRNEIQRSPVESIWIAVCTYYTYLHVKLKQKKYSGT